MVLSGSILVHVCSHLSDADDSGVFIIFSLESQKERERERLAPSHILESLEQPE